MNNALFKAILSMDSYNRGYDEGIDFNIYDDNGTIISTPNQIGNATILTDSLTLGTTNMKRWGVTWK